MKVVIGVFINEQQQILITRRHWSKSHGGYWEFPGGKLEFTETAEQALKREMEEELDVHVLSFQYLGDISHSYAHTEVTLIVFQVTDFIGEPICREDQLELQWVGFDKLGDYAFPEANLEIIRMIRGC